MVAMKLQINEIPMRCRYHLVYNVEAFYENISSRENVFNMEARG